MTEIVKLTDPSRSEFAWRQVFLSNDPFQWPFRRPLTSAIAVFPTDGCQLNKHQFDAIAAAAATLNEDHGFLSVIESENSEFWKNSQSHWLVPFHAFSEYAELHLTLENALYSPSGQWGAIISHEMHALISGPPSFL